MSDHTPAGHPLVPDTASWAYRVAALFLDWIASSLVAAFILGGFDRSGYQLLALGLFWLESAVGIALTGASFGQKLLRITVHQIDGRPMSVFRALERQLLICLVIPPLVFRADGRGLHDLLTNSAAYRPTA
jgi:hypothetical protein